MVKDASQKRLRKPPQLELNRLPYNTTTRKEVACYINNIINCNLLQGGRKKEGGLQMIITKEGLERSKIFQNLVYIEAGDKRYTKDDLLKYIENNPVEVAYAR